MLKYVILVLSLLMLVGAFFSISLKPKKVKRTLPEGIEERFKQYCDGFLANIGISAKEVEIKKINLLEEVPFEDGTFEFHSFDFNLTPSKAVSDKDGIVLTVTEVLLKAGMKGNPVLVFFRSGEDIYEISFVSDREVAAKGYKGYIVSRYSNIKNPAVSDEYSITLDGKKIRLWENLKGEAPFEQAVQTRERTSDILNEAAEFSDTWEGQNIRISTWVQFEKKREMVYRIRSNNPAAETHRGIHVGSSIEDLKKKYKGELAFERDFKGGGACYGYIPRDSSYRYIAFFAENGAVSEIWITDGFTSRPFKRPEGYVDDDIPWLEYDNKEKFSERYAREIYIGQHKSDFDSEKVFHTFIAKELIGMQILETGLTRENPGEREYYIICQKRNDPEKVYVEVKLKRVKLLNSVTRDEIWVINEYRSQARRDED